MIWRIRERRGFSRLSAEGRRVRAGVLWCTYVLDPPGIATPPRVAFALGRALGPAVTRNLVRRRLRSLLNDMPNLPAGSYLLGAQPAAATASFADLKADLAALVARIPS